MDAITEAYGGNIRMIDGTSVRVHHSAATLKKATQIVILDEAGLPLKIVLTPGETHDSQAAAELLADIGEGETVLADRAYDADWIRNMMNTRGAWANIPPRSNRKDPICFSPWLYKKRNLVERFFNKLKYFRRIATRYDKLGTSFLAMVTLACIRLRLRHYKSVA